MKEKGSCLICGCLAEHLFCENCSVEGQKKHKAIETFLAEFPGATVIEVCREVQVPLPFIKGLINLGYLNTSLPSPVHKNGPETIKTPLDGSPMVSRRRKT